MVRTKNVSAPGGGDDEDPPRPFRQVKGKIVYLEQQEGRKKRRLDRAARAALAATAVAEQAERGGQLQISSDQIAYRVRCLASRPRSSAPSTPATATTPPPTSPAPVAPEPSTTSAIPTTSTTPASTVPPPAPISAPPIPPARFRERDETEVRPLATDPCLINLQRATAARVRRFRQYPWSLGYLLRGTLQRQIFSTPEFRSRSFFRAQMSAQIALRVHRLLDLSAFLLAPGADSEVHLSFLPGLLTLLSTSDRYVEEWVRVFYASVWIDPDHQWMRFRFEREDALFMLARFTSCLDLPSRRLAFTACAMVLPILLGALTTELLRPQLTSRPCFDCLSQMGRDALQHISFQRPSISIRS
jgi:hypothetical protein